MTMTILLQLIILALLMIALFTLLYAGLVTIHFGVEKLVGKLRPHPGDDELKRLERAAERLAASNGRPHTDAVIQRATRRDP